MTDHRTKMAADIATHPLTRAIVTGLRHRCGVRAEKDKTLRVVVAASGGADSTALLHVLAALTKRRRWPLKLTVGHVRHHLRDRDQTEADSDFVAELSARLELPYLQRDLDPHGHTGNTENWARRARYAALESIANQSDSRAVVVAHHADDQLETVLMRLLRGASVTGLAGMAWKRKIRKNSSVRLLRPMLGARHADAIDLLDTLGESWREDPTNQNTDRLRSRLRADVLPRLGEIAPTRIAELTDHLRDVSELLKKSDTPTALESRDAMRSLPRAAAITTLRNACLTAGVPSDTLRHAALRKIHAAICDAKGGRRRFELAGGVTIRIDREHVQVRVRARVPACVAAAQD